MKRKIGKFGWVITVVWFAALILFIKTAMKAPEARFEIVSFETFSENADVIVNEARVGAKVTLKEAIHGTDGITYRYIVKTDCPSWDYETRYATTTPISWATDDTAAVEVLIYDAQVRFYGTAYSSGTYYTIPLFGGLSSEQVSLEEWKQQLVKDAYTACVASVGSDTKRKYANPYAVLTFGIPIALIIYAYVPVKKKKKEESDPTDFLDR